MKAEIWKDILRQHGCLNDGRIVVSKNYRALTIDFSNNHCARSPGRTIEDKGQYFIASGSIHDNSLLRYYLWEDVVSISFYKRLDDPE